MVSRKKRFFTWWRRAGMGLRVVLFGLSVAVFGLLIYWQRPQDQGGQFASNFLVFALVNINIIILVILGFLVGRNVIKLIFDRKANIIGSRLRQRLVVAFVGLTLIPTVILFVLASGLLTTAMEGWFSNQVEASVGGAVEVARHHYAFLKEHNREIARELNTLIKEKFAVAKDVAELDEMLELKRKEMGLFSVRIFDKEKNSLLEVHSAAAVIDNFSEPVPNIEALERAIRGEESAIPEKREGGHFIRVYYPLGAGEKAAVLMTSMRMDPELTHAIEVVNDSYHEYEQLKIFKNPLRSSYMLTLAMITGLILFSAIWVGFYLARGIAVPIQRIAEGTTEVARGNYNFQIRVAGDDELGFLAKSFNTMTNDLKRSNQEIARQQNYLEAILANMAVGVIGLDRRGIVTSVNAAAQRLFELDEAGSITVVGKELREVIRPEQYEALSELLPGESADGGAGTPVREHEFNLVSRGRELKIVCTAGTMADSDGRWLGTILLFDDVTDLAKAQHMSAWREVARRIAHEIKNPLTPIQLSAQRLEKLSAQTTDYPIIRECTQTIVEHVNSIKRLANEFSHFARMPTAELRREGINALVTETISFFAETHGELVIQFISDKEIPDIFLDREQIRRMLINLLDNAVAAVDPAAAKGGSGAAAGRIEVMTKYDKARKIVLLEVADNGPGVPDAEKSRVFEPYFTTKKGGTGLGLAIVISIVTDHQGAIRVVDNKGGGARFVVELPIEPSTATQRRFATTRA